MRSNISKLLSSITKIVLFASSYIPLFIIFILQLIQPFIEEHDNLNLLEKDTWKNILEYKYLSSIILLIVLIILLFLVLNYLVKRKYDENLLQELEVNNIQNINVNYITNYFSVYIFPFITLNLISFAGIGTLTILIVIIGYVYIKNDILYINPILNIFFKFNIYSVDVNGKSETKEIILLSRKSRVEIKISPNISTYRIGYNVFIEL